MIALPGEPPKLEESLHTSQNLVPPLANNSLLSNQGTQGVQLFRDCNNGLIEFKLPQYQLEVLNYELSPNTSLDGSRVGAIILRRVWALIGIASLGVKFISLLCSSNSYEMPRGVYV